MGVLQQEPVEDIWVQDDSTGKWQNNIKIYLKEK
jgi:hypothetical protein